jgi:hypothetical protein
MKRILIVLLIAFAIPATAFAAISGTGGGTTIANGQATLVSNSTAPYSYISFNDLNGQPVANLTELSADVLSASWGGGSPRFSVEVSNGTTNERIFVYLGDLPNLTSGATGETGNLLDDTLSGARVDSTQVGGPFYGTWAQAISAATGSGYGTISNTSVVVDGGWAQTSGSQTVVLDAVSINGVVYNFTATAKSDCKDGNWQALGYKNQGACISFVETGK